MAETVQQTITPHVKDLGSFQVRRVLPQDDQQMVGSFIFFDHLGPATFPPGEGMDVRPHPHINLATVTYLFEGVLLHRDSLGSVQEIHPGAVNWMTAGRGITHSERSHESERAIESTLHGIQTWVALPATDEETDPAFYHYPADRLPVWEEQGAIVKLIAGQFQGRTSPVKTFSPTLYLDIQLAPGSRFTLPAEYGEQAIYSVTAGLSLDRAPLEQHRMAILTAGQAVEISSSSEGRCMVIGGEPMGQHYKWWNFVSSRRDRIEQAKQDWLAGKFESVPEETEFIPLPEEDATS